MATVGKIPDRRDVTLIGNVYNGAAKKLTKIFKSVYPIDEFLILETPRLMKEVRSIVNHLNRFAISWSRSSVTRAYSEAQAISETKLRALKEKADPEFDEDIHKITKDKFSEATTEDLVKANQSILVTANIFFEVIGKTKEGLLQIQAFDFRDEEVIAGLVDDAIREGESRGQIAKRIREYIQKIIGDEQYIQINGRNYNMKKYSKMVARTRLRKVQSESTRNTCKQFDHDIVEISDHGTETEICQEFEGNIYSLDGATKGFPVLTQEPPYHPNCQHSMFPTSVEAIASRG